MRKRMPANLTFSTAVSMGAVTLNLGGATAPASSVYTVFQGDTPVLRGSGSTIKGLKAGTYTVVIETPDESAVIAEFKL